MSTQLTEWQQATGLKRTVACRHMGIARTSAAADPYPQDTQVVKCLFRVLSSHLCDLASPGEMTGAALPGLGEKLMPGMPGPASARDEVR